MRIILVPFLVVFFYINPLMGQISAPKYSNEFLSIGVGARAFGMSNAQTAIVNDVTSAYWNPAGLLQIRTKYELALMHSEYFAGIAQYDYAGFATPIDTQSIIAVSVIRFGVDNIPDTRFLFDEDGNLDYNRISYFGATDYAFLLSYAQKSNLIQGLRLGVNAKIIYRHVGDFANAWGFGLDAGAQYERKGWQFGLMARDVTSTFNAWTHNTELVKEVYTQTGNEIPDNSIEVTLPKLIVGAARSFKIKNNFGILASADLNFTFDGRRNVLIKSKVTSIDPNIGIEADYKKIVYLRFGVGNIQKIKAFDNKSYTSVQPNFGIGVRINKRFFIDYALTDIGNTSESLYSNVFSIKVALN